MKTQPLYSALVLAAAIGLAGCMGTYNGGGMIPSASGVPGQKATFGFTIHVDNDGVDCDTIESVRGQFQYNDHGTQVSFHARIKGHAFVLDEFDAHLAFVGEYLVRGQPAGEVLIRVEDVGKGAERGFLWLSVLDGPLAGYSNSGIVERGNITYKPDKLCL